MELCLGAGWVSAKPWNCQETHKSKCPRKFFLSISYSPLSLFSGKILSLIQMFRLKAFSKTFFQMNLKLSNAKDKVSRNFCFSLKHSVLVFFNISYFTFTLVSIMRNFCRFEYSESSSIIRIVTWAKIIKTIAISYNFATILAPKQIKWDENNSSGCNGSCVERTIVSNILFLSSNCIENESVLKGLAFVWCSSNQSVSVVWFDVLKYSEKVGLVWAREIVQGIELVVQTSYLQCTYNI